MPIYAYQCAACKRKLDIFQHFTDDALQVCPECGELELQKQYQPVGIIFKGMGFYATDKAVKHE